MKKILLAFALTVASCLAWGQSDAQPRLRQTQNGTQLLVDGQPFLMLAGELHNSSGGSAHWLRPIWKRMADRNLNTVIASVSWELIEPEEGKFDFSLVDSTILGAREQNLKLVLIWFGSWKNAESTYVPAWVKQDAKRFPRVRTADGKTLNILSALSENTLRADANAFAALMSHIKQIDERHHTVLMMQVENELGTYDMLSFYGGKGNFAQRDYSDVANKAFRQQVPARLIAYLKAHKKELHPHLLSVWQANGFKEKGTWEEVFGKGQPRQGKDWQNEFPYYTEEIFNAWNYGCFVGEVARRGKEAYHLPMYVNAWLKQESGPEPGFYPSGAAHPHVFDIWRAAAPSIDLFAPDIYAVNTFDWVCADYSRSGNPLFIPETAPNPDSAARAFLAFGKYDALGYAPFGVDGHWYFNNLEDADKSFDVAYACLKPLMPEILKYRGTDRMTGLFFDGKGQSDSVEMGDYTVTISRFSTQTSAALFGVRLDEAKQTRIGCGALVIQTADNEFLIAGGIGGMSVRITKGKNSKAENVGYLSVDEITFDAHGNRLTHRLNGDEASFNAATVLPGRTGIFQIKMFAY